VAKKKAPTRKARGKKAVKQATTAVKARSGKPIKAKTTMKDVQVRKSPKVVDAKKSLDANNKQVKASGGGGRGTLKAFEHGFQLAKRDQAQERLAKAKANAKKRQEKRGKQAKKSATKAVKARKGKPVKKKGKK
jgi:hypothetical protein